MAVTVLPSPGGVVTVCVRSDGNLKKAGSRPCSLPARSGFGPWNGTYVGSLTAPPEAAAPGVAPPPAAGFAGEAGVPGAHASNSDMPTAPAVTRPARVINA